MERYGNETNKPIQERENMLAYVRAQEDVKHIIDGLGLGIDEEIKDTIAILRAMKFEMDGSCAGHTDREKGWHCTPYIDFCTPEPKDWKENIEMQELWKAKNLEQQARIHSFLQDFYSTQDTNSDVKLMLDSIGVFGAFRLESKGSNNLKWEDRIEKVNKYQKEMSDFTEFLKGKFLGK